MPSSENIVPTRKPSRLGLHCSNSSRPDTPQCASSSSKRDRHNTTGLRNLFEKFRGHGHMLTPPSSSPTTLQALPPQISDLAKAFADALTAQQLSNFLIWMLYYDVVVLPESPDEWYFTVDPMEMHGWVALGDFLTRTADIGHGLDLIALDSICDRINLNRRTVYEMLMQFANPEKMVYSQIATTFAYARTQSLSKVKTLEAVHAKLHELHKLASHLKPSEGSKYQVWNVVVQKRLREFLHLVIGPRMKHLRSGAPLVTATASDRMPKGIEDGVKLNYLIEAMQEERVVPLARYGTFPAAAVSGDSTLATLSSNIISEETERARNYVIPLMAENQDLRGRIARLENDKDKLVKSNESLARKVAMLDSHQSAGHYTSATNNVRSHFSSFSSESPSHHQPSPSSSLPRPRSHSEATGSHNAAELKTNARAHARHSAEVIGQKYGSVFSALDATPPPAFRLTIPTKLESAELAPSSYPPSSPPQIYTYTRPGGANPAPGVSRRSGMIFSPSVQELVARFGNGTDASSGEVEDEDDWVDEGVETPTPAERGRFRRN